MSPPVPGDVVTIYVDPLTEATPDGTAELVQPVGELDVTTGLQRWRVYLPDRPELPWCIRTIRVRPQLVLLGLVRELRAHRRAAS